VLKVLYHHAKFGVARVLDAAVSVCHAFVVCAHDFAKKALEYRNDFDAVG